MNDGRKDTGEHDFPDNPQNRPEETVDALEADVLGSPRAQRRDEGDTAEAAFQQDFDTSDPREGNRHEPEEPPS